MNTLKTFLVSSIITRKRYEFLTILQNILRRIIVLIQNVKHHYAFPRGKVLSPP